MNYRVLGFTILVSLTAVFSGGYAAGDDSSRGGAQSTNATRPDYVLQPQDVIKVQVFQEEDINKQTEELSLSQDCRVMLPLIGTISLQGKSVRQAEELIRQLYDKDYIVNPQVTVFVTKYAERTVNVIGSVTQQGRIKFPEERGLTIVDAISLAGGQTRLADLKHVKLTRGTDTTTVDVDAMMKSGGREPLQLQPDDVIFVPERIL